MTEYGTGIKARIENQTNPKVNQLSFFVQIIETDREDESVTVLLSD